MDLEQLQSVRDRERRTDKLQELRASFYTDAAELIATLREEREAAAAAADDPFDDDRVNRLSDQINTAERTVEAIYEKRVGKLVKAASFAAADIPAETEGMTAEERELYDALVATIRTNRRRVLEGIVDASGDASGTGEDAEPPARTTDAAPASDDPTGAEPPPPPDEPGPEDSAESGAAGQTGDSTGESPTDDSSPPATATEDDVDRTTVRITTDVGEIFGVDEREYHLETDDVVTLPAANAEPLLERDAAELLE